MIRQFRPEDAHACSELVRAALLEDASTTPELRRHLVALESAEAMTERSRLFYMAVFTEDSAAVIGVGGVDMNEIRLLYVSPDRQRRGIGRALLRHLEEWVPAALFPDVFVYSALSATGFYAAHGYRAEGEHVIDIDGQPMTTVFMRKNLVRGV